MHLPIGTWLEATGLLEYLNLFDKFTGVEDLLCVTEGGLKELGVKNSAHRAKLISSLKLLKVKYEKAQGKRGQAQFNAPSTSTTSSLQRSQSSLSAASASTCGPIYQDCNALTASPEKMQQDLKSELRGDSSELRSYIWYHGNIPRQRAEKLVVGKGDYLVRDCVSQPGNFVLTCNWMGVALHFMINSKVVNPAAGGPPRIFYQFEDVSCESVPDLLQYYRDMGKPVTESSGVLVSNPIGRTMPLSYYDTKYGATANLSAKLGLQGTHTPSQSPKPSPFASPNRSPRASPKLRRTPHRTGSQPLLSVDNNERGSPSPSLTDQFGSLPSINNPPPPPCPMTHESLSPPFGLHHRRGSEPLLTPTNDNHSFSYEADLEEKLAPAGSDGNLNKAPPPKPSRVPSVKYMKKPKVQLRNKKLYEDEEDRDYTDYDTIKSKPSWLKSQTLGTNQLFSGTCSSPFEQILSTQEQSIYDNNFSRQPAEPIYEALNNKSDKVDSIENQRGGDSPRKGNNNNSLNQNDSNTGLEESFYDMNFLRNRVITFPKTDNDACYIVDSFTTSLLPAENRPLEASAMVKVKTLLLECNAKILARHLTQVDLEMSKVIGDHDLGLGVQSGLELLTLPQGSQLRQDLMERCRCVHMFVATMILTCSGILERARMLSQWINIAMELRTSMGNLFGFTAVMEGLLAEEIKRLRDTWMILRQNHTSSAFLFDTKLKTFHKTLTDASASLPVQNICLPNIANYISLMERDNDNIMDLLPWESTNDDSGMDIFLAHLDMGRNISSQFGTYRSMGQAVLKDFREDRELRDLFETPFHLRLLWGSRGAGVNRPDRYNKYQQLMMVLSERAERPDDMGTEL